MKVKRRFLKTGEVAEQIAISPRQVRRLVRRKIISQIKIGGAVRFDPEVLEREIEAMTMRSLSESTGELRQPRATALIPRRSTT
jgi:excisionase family DNA binding protein